MHSNNGDDNYSNRNNIYINNINNNNYNINNINNNNNNIAIDRYNIKNNNNKRQHADTFVPSRDYRDNDGTSDRPTTFFSVACPPVSAHLSLRRGQVAPTTRD